MSARGGPRSAAGGGPARLLLLAVLLAACGLPSMALSVSQAEAAPLAPVAPLALLAAACSLLLLPVPLRAPRVADHETDVIASIPPLLVGAWLLGAGPSRLGDHFWVWRPDLVGLWLCAVGMACLLMGTRATGFLAVPLAGAALAATPIAQLLLAGFAPGPTRAALVAAGLTGLPFVLTRLPNRRLRVRRLLVAAAAAVLAVLATAGLHLGTSHAAALGATLAVLAGGACAAAAAPQSRRGLPVDTLGRGRGALLLVACAVVALVEVRAMPGWRSPGARGAVEPAVHAASYQLRPGVRASAWSFDPGGPDDQRGMVVVTSGPSLAGVLTYPLDSLVHWPVDACPAAATMDVAGLRVAVHLYADVERGFRWSTLEWLARPAGGALQRVSLILAQGPSGAPAPLPTFGPVAALDAVRTAGRFMATRHLDCQRDAPQGTGVLRRVIARVLPGRGA